MNGRLIVDGGGSHAGVDEMGKIFFEKGFMTYWQLGGAKAMKFWRHPPGMERMNVPLEYLFPQDVRDDGNP